MERQGHGDPAFDGGAGCRGRRPQVDPHFGGAHTPKEVTIVGGKNFFSVTEDSPGPSAAEAAARVGDDASGLSQSGNGAGFDCFHINLTAGRCDNGLDSHLFAFQYGSSSFKIFQAAVGTGTNEYLVKLGSLKF